MITKALPAPLAGLAMFGQFLNYITVPVPGKKDRKIPTNARGEAVDPTNPANWMDADTALASGLPVAFQFTKDDPFFFLDIDGALQPDGTWSPLAMEMLGRLQGCAVEVSHSGKGLHIFGIGSVGEHSCRFDQLGLEFYTQDRFVALTGTSALGDCTFSPPAEQLEHIVRTYFPARKGGDFEWTNGPVAEWRGPTDDEDLVRRAKMAQSTAAAFAGRASFADLWDRNDEALARSFPADPGSTLPYNGSSADAALAAHLAFWTGKDCERMERLIKASGLARDKHERADYMERTILAACAVTSAVCIDKELEPVRSEVNQTQSGRPECELVTGSTFVKVEDQIKLFSGCVYIRSENKVWTPSGEILKPEAFNVLFGGFSFVISEDGKCTKNAFDAFTKSPLIRCPQVSALGFDPSEPPGALLRNYRGRQAVNTWIDPKVVTREGDASPFYTHLAKLLPDSHDRAVLMSWMAALVQYPGKKFAWSPVLQGVEGNGKSFFSYACEYAVSPLYTHWPRVIDLKNPQFNGWMSRRLLACVEDVYSSSPDFFENLKPLITGETQTIERKGVDADAERVFMNLIFNMNSKTGLRKSKNDRRLAIFFTPQQEEADLERDGMGLDYMRSLYGWAKGLGEWAEYGPNYGFSIIAHELKTFKIPERLDPTKLASRAPKTTAAKEAITASLGAREQELQNAIDSDATGFRGGWVSSYYALELLRRSSAKGSAVTMSHLETLLSSLGYVRHPALGPEGRPNNQVMPDKARSRLFVHKGRLDLLAAGSNAEAARMYTEAQNAL